MSELLSSQTCPYCGYEEDDSYAEWDEGRHEAKCNNCNKEYSVAPMYKFQGFLVEKHCDRCGFHEDECECDPL